MVSVDEAVTALRMATTWLVDELESAGPADLDVPAGPVEWSCWATLDHVADCQLGYALQLASGAPDDYLRVDGGSGSEDFVHFVRELGVSGVRTALPAFAELLCAQASVTSADTRAFHSYGTSDAAGFAAMGAVEMLLHGHDVLGGLGRDCELPAEPAQTVLARLFPDVAAHGSGPARTLLWATGRDDLPGRDRVRTWRWDGRVR